ncbi:MAG TPA: phenylalanine--tRNA ligase subunit beta [Desulfobacterales bacterium]|nr:phenylalanine--tRNA ligase subunit beta [Desulfobacterales bacterium]
MKISLSWLRDYVPIEMEVDQLAEALTMVGLEVSSVSDRYDYLDSVVVGRIAKITPHLKSDHLKICHVNLGERLISVVCGAPNVAEGMLAPVALPGTVFPDGAVLKKSIIRGEKSEGMLCSEAELELGEDRNGIMELGSSLTVGECLAKALDLADKVIEIDLTPNRPDCLSMIGIAREVAALHKTSVTYPDAAIFESENYVFGLTSVSIESPDLCPRYAARIVENLKVAPSPFWLRDRLLSVGLRPINNIVDITNFVMMEIGQPLHAFDFDRLAENRIVVRTAREGEKIFTLDRKERSLSQNMLMICDGEKPVALAGVMGGSNSEIDAATTRVLIESAYFTPVGIRKTSKKLGLSTEASHRFERGVDPSGTITALNRAARLMVEVCGGTFVEGVIDEYPRPIGEKRIRLSVKDASRLLGLRLDQNEIERLLQSIEFKTEKATADKLFVIPPSFRVDISGSIDLVEEIARLSGYDKIPTTFPLIPAEARRPLKRLDLRNKIKSLMNGFGFTEVINYSFIREDSCDRLRFESDDRRRDLVKILNPLTEDQAVMRSSLIPGLLETMRRNVGQQIKTLQLFEVGKIFIGTGQENLPEEIEILAGLWTGKRIETTWYSKETDCDFYDMKGIVEGLLNALNLDPIKFTRIPDRSCTYTKPGHTAQIVAQNKIIGLVGEIDPQVLLNFDLKQPAFIFETSLEHLGALMPAGRQAKPVPKFPAVSRDITIIVPGYVVSSDILESIDNFREELVEATHLIDVYEGRPIPPGKKSISLRITYRSNRKTLEDDEVSRIHKTITQKLIVEFDAELPG